MKFNATLARILRDELIGATVTNVDEFGYLSGDCRITVRLSDGREAMFTADKYWSEFSKPHKEGER